MIGDNTICTVPKESLKEKFYLIEQANGWILWHGTLENLENSLLGSLRRLEYTRTADTKEAT